MPTSRGNHSSQNSMRSHNCKSIQTFLPIRPLILSIIIKLLIIASLPSKVRPPSLPTLGSLVSLSIVGRIGTIAIQSSKVSLVILVSLEFLFSLGSLLIHSVGPFATLPVRYPIMGMLPMVGLSNTKVG